MQIINQKPFELSPVINDNVSHDMDPTALIQQTMIQPLRTPMAPNSSVIIKNGQTTISDTDILNQIYNCITSDHIDIQTEDFLRDLYSQGMAYYTAKGVLSFRNIFAVQAGNKQTPTMPEPDAMHPYRAEDVKKVCRKFLGGYADGNKVFTTITYFAKPVTLGVYFATESDFNDFKTWFASCLPLYGQLDPDIQNLCHEVQNLTLTGLTESIVLRDTYNDQNQANSFARILAHSLMLYTSQVPDDKFGLMPFDLYELFVPQSIVFVNIEAHSQASLSTIKTEWNIINQSVQAKIPMVGLKHLSKLTAMQRISSNIAQAAATATKNQQNGSARGSSVPFRKNEPASVDIYHAIRNIMVHMGSVNRSMNTYKTARPTFARANRRDPDDFNKPGRSVSTKYRPDLHIYLDTSGSISEKNYEDAIKSCIALAKQLNVDLYFNSFSDTLSQTAHIHIKDKSVNQIYKNFQKIPKVTGGTNYHLVWDFINCNSKRKKELSLLITDFQFSPYFTSFSHPKHLYYLPCSHMDWQSICHAADSFMRSMQILEPNIRKYMLL